MRVGETLLSGMTGQEFKKGKDFFLTQLRKGEKNCNSDCSIQLQKEGGKSGKESLSSVQVVFPQLDIQQFNIHPPS